VDALKPQLKNVAIHQSLQSRADFPPDGLSVRYHACPSLQKLFNFGRRRASRHIPCWRGHLFTGHSHRLITQKAHTKRFRYRKALNQLHQLAETEPIHREPDQKPEQIFRKQTPNASEVKSTTQSIAAILKTISADDSNDWGITRSPTNRSCFIACSLAALKFPSRAPLSTKLSVALPCSLFHVSHSRASSNLRTATTRALLREATTQQEVFLRRARRAAARCVSPCENLTCAARGNDKKSFHFRHNFFRMSPLL
jgi:hypothetical protein